MTGVRWGGPVPDLPRVVGKYPDIYKTANICGTVRICDWRCIGSDAHIGCNAIIGNFCEINSGATIGCVTVINLHCDINSDSIVGNNIMLRDVC